jgi:hypothetical protein
MFIIIINPWSDSTLTLTSKIVQVSSFTPKTIMYVLTVFSEIEAGRFITLCGALLKLLQVYLLFISKPSKLSFTLYIIPI